MALTASGRLSLALRSAQLSLPAITSVRYRRNMPVRKPIWYPTAPSKIYEIPERPVWPEEEQKWMDALEIDYRNAYRSIQDHLRVNFYELSLKGGLSATEIEQEQQEQQRLIVENERENKRVAAARAERWTQESQQQEHDQLLKELQTQEKVLLHKEQVKQRILDEKRRSETYIDESKLVTAIEHALDNPLSYEFAIGADGRLVFDGKLHPYALRPTAVPETSNVIEECAVFDDCEHFLPAKILSH